MLAATANSLFLQILGAVIGGIVLVGVLDLGRRGRKVFIKGEKVLDRIASFGEQWTAAEKLAATISETRTDLGAIVQQLGPAKRDPKWDTLEAYLHAWRHEQRNDVASLQLTVQLLEKVAGQMKVLSDQLVGIATDVRKDRTGA